ncbi:MAG: AbrB/MazE/SpoVT family DNA-binding domain-containing protein [Kiritimatiellae bacterium]|nr:AbrB/MazE/SpoVT family DNA-binding domain-containing protein [Kiritimatiellia bacterium]
MTKVTERGQVSIPASIRESMRMTPGTALLWTRGEDGCTCVVTIVRKPQRKGAKAMLGYASTFRKPRTTAEWMKELREGEER